jgi:FecR protein
MTSKERKHIHWPTPLRDRDNRLGTAVREYAQSTEESRAEAAVYARVLALVGGRSRRVPLLAAGFVITGVLATAVVALVVRHRVTDVSTSRVTVASNSAVPVSAPPRPSPSTETALPAARSSRTTSASAPPTASIHLAALPVSLPTGSVTLVDQATAVLSADAVASARAQTGDTEIVLSKGSIELHVLPRAPGHDFAVNAGLYRFTVVGTAFTVSQTRSRLELAVSEGTVAVWRGTKRLAMVGAGAQWSADVSPAASARPQTLRAQAEPSSAVVPVEPLPRETPGLAPPPVPTAAVAGTPPRPSAPTPPPETPPATSVYPDRATASAPAALRRDCGQLAASKRAQEALTCYQEQAAQSGLAGETALYELARLWRDSFGQLDRALAAFQAQRARFPNGVLRTEADLSIIELLPRLDRHADALAESAHFLSAHPKAERSGELHLLRGNIFREVLRDLDHAEREYALGAGARGRVGDDSQFMHAVCLEALGREEQARKAYEAYLLRTGATHAQEAKTRLERLRP